ncbi:AUGMIN subunit 2-like isoform X2 [Mangifera indica]|uniref:AUGMIN subunit 2-like isoform X2 n=1 Tax=Mangifera indica TaxID=29780 RepID=UPI001CF9A1FE|nr:AUGMIN subunit 2-like isoform X2 [Mangifera indica]
MEKKIETLSRITTIMKDVIQNKDHIIAHLQQPYSLDCILVEAEFQISNGVIILRNLLQFGGYVYEALDWFLHFKSRLLYLEMPRPIPVVSASCTRFFEAMSAMRESVAALQHLRVGHFQPS